MSTSLPPSTPNKRAHCMDSDLLTFSAAKKRFGVENVEFVKAKLEPKGCPLSLWRVPLSVTTNLSPLKIGPKSRQSFEVEGEKLVNQQRKLDYRESALEEKESAVKVKESEIETNETVVQMVHLDLVVKGLTEQLQTLQTQLRTQQDEHRAEMQALRDEHRAEMQALRDQHAIDIASLGEKNAEENAALRDKIAALEKKGDNAPSLQDENDDDGEQTK